MAVSEEFLNYVVDQFRELGAVTTRKMFGGVGVYFDGKFFALLDNDELYLKADDSNRSRFEDAGTHPFEPWEGHVMSGYWSVPVDVLEDPGALAEWSQHSIKIAKAPKKKPANKKGGTRKPKR
ncbi:MAG: TfoX/Sxy family protein [Planctomycetes bacterium]|nr:TfoX/Sxy family protein [Planctomycetota bacterium]